MGLLPDLLDQHGASDDHMEALIEHIAVLATKMSTGHTHQELTPQTRQGCAEAMNRMLQKMRLPISSWFHAMELLDMYCHAGGQLDPTQIPTVCTAIAIIVGKFEGASVITVRRMINDDSLMNNIYEKEKEILEVLQFRVRCPTLCSWFDIFLARLRLVMSDNVTNQWGLLMYQVCMHYAFQYVSRHACIPHPNLRNIARGLIGMACVAIAKKMGLAISQPCELPKQIQTPVLSAIGVDVQTLMQDHAMVTLSMHPEPSSSAVRVSI